jgi:hypothetical protein
MTGSGEMSLDKRRGHRPRLIAPGVGRRPVLTLADRLLATVLHQRLALPQVAIATLFSVRPETMNRRIRDTRQLMEQAGHVIQDSPHRLASLEDLFRPGRRRGHHRTATDQDSVLIICGFLGTKDRSAPSGTSPGRSGLFGAVWLMS